MKDHLASTRVVLKDWKESVGTVGQRPYEVVLGQYTNVYPFGMEQPGRSWNGDPEYRYGYNGKEHDPELGGEKVNYNYGWRQYDARVARFLSVDPLASSYPYYTPYQFAGNSPIANEDLDGLEPKPASGAQGGNGSSSGAQGGDGGLFDVAQDPLGYTIKKAEEQKKAQEGGRARIGAASAGAKPGSALSAAKAAGSGVDNSSMLEGMGWGVARYATTMIPSMSGQISARVNLDMTYTLAHGGTTDEVVASGLSSLQNEVMVAPVVTTRNLLRSATLEGRVELAMEGAMAYSQADQEGKGRMIGELVVGPVLTIAVGSAPSVVRAVGGSRGTVGVLKPSGPSSPAVGVTTTAETASYVNLVSPQRVTHILYSDATGGGHMWTIKTLFNGKSKFPLFWSKEKILNSISEVATANTWVQQTGVPGTSFTRAGLPATYTTTGQYQGVTIKVVIRPAGEGIITAFPIKP